MGLFAFRHEKFFCEPFGKAQTPLPRSPGYHPVKMKPDQKEVFGLFINSLYLLLARTSSFPVPSREGRAPVMRHAKLPTILSPSTPERLFPRSSSCLLQVVFFPLRSLLFLPGYLRDKSDWGEKGFKNPLARDPQIYFWRAFFFLSKQKSHRVK